MTEMTPEPERPRLTSTAVGEMMSRCLFANDELRDNAIEVEGIVNRYAFHRGRIAENAEAIAQLLAELPDEFQSSKGTGSTFLNACNDRHGNQWTGQHLQMDWLFCLGIAAGKARWLMRRSLWGAPPGNMAMPYVSVN